jgi:hypothetical protein
MKCFLVPAILVVVGLLSCGAMGDTFLQGLAGPTGLANEGSQGSSPANDRFVDSPSFIGAPYDWSGVGNNGGSWATMISPSYFVSANHDHPAPGSTITFHLDNNPNGPTESYTVDSTFYQTQYGGQGSDLYLGKLTTPVSSNIAKYPVLSLGSDAAYTNMPIYTYGYPNRVGMNNINGDFLYSEDGVSPPTLHHGINDLNLPGYGLTRVMYYSYNATGGQGANEAYLEGGDSGGPSFAVWNGALALLGIHFVDDGRVYDGAPSGDSFVPFYVNQLDANMVGEQVTLSVVPEPVTMVSLFIGLAGLAGHIRKRIRK